MNTCLELFYLIFFNYIYETKENDGQKEPYNKKQNFVLKSN